MRHLPKGVKSHRVGIDAFRGAREGVEHDALGVLLVGGQTAPRGERVAQGRGDLVQRPAEVLVSGRDARVVRRRERLEDLWAEEL